MKANLDPFEKEIESSSFKPVTESKRRQIESIIDKAKKTKNINIRISEYDLEKIREISEQEGLPYQTLITSILHKYVTNKLLDEKSLLRAINLLGKRSDQQK